MRELTQKEESSLYSICLDMGLEVSYGKLSICDLSYHRHSHVTKNRRWQVHCDDNRNSFSGLFDDKLDAIEKFMEIKPSVKPRTR